MVGTDPDWQDLGMVSELALRELQQVVIGRTRIALSCVDGVFGAVSGACNHVGGPLGEGRSRATSSSVHGTTTSSIALLARVSLASRRIRCRASPCGRTRDVSS